MTVSPCDEQGYNTRVSAGINCPDVPASRRHHQHPQQPLTGDNACPIFPSMVEDMSQIVKTHIVSRSSAATASAFGSQQRREPLAARIQVAGYIQILFQQLKNAPSNNAVFGDFSKPRYPTLTRRTVEIHHHWGGLLRTPATIMFYRVTAVLRQQSATAGVVGTNETVHRALMRLLGQIAHYAAAPAPPA